MGIIPPSIPWKPLRVAMDAVRDAVPAAVVTLAAAVPPPQPDPEPQDWVVVLCRNGFTERITKPMTIDEARNYQTRIADQTNGEMGSKLIQKWVGARLRPRM